MTKRILLAALLALAPAFALAQAGNPAPTVSLTSPASGTSITTSGYFTLSANASDNGAVIVVEFYADNVLVGSDYDAPYGMTLAGLAIGSHTIYAKAIDDSGKTKNSTSVSVSVSNQPPAVTLTSPNTSSVYSAPGTLNLTAVATDDNGSVTSVQFKSGTTVLYTDTTVPYAYTWANVPAGTYSLTAVATDNLGTTTTTPVASVKVSTGGTVSATRSYVYDQYKRLCKTIEPESGATVVDYDAAGNIAWSADGQTLPSTSSCDRTLVAENQKMYRQYDAMNRPTAVTTPNGDADSVTTYYPDGAVASVMAANPGANLVTTTYFYNKRRLLTQEQLQVNTLLPWTFGYAYNANGHLSSQTYPGNLVVGYAPDGLGRPTQAGTFATGVTYYPNGAMSGFTYGNGIVHAMTQNARQLPSRSVDSYTTAGVSTKVLDDTFTYDADGNVLSLADASNAAATENRSWGGGTTPTLYDGLDRLLKVFNANWGTATGGYNAIYTYDPLDNLRSNTLGASTLTYTYDAGNKLASLSYNGGAVQAITTDVRGNIIADAYRGQAYQFDLAHRLSAVTTKESYLYDGHGRRARTLNLQTGTIEYFGYGKDGRLLQDWSNRRQVRNGYIYLGNTVVGLYEVNLTNGTVNPRYKHTDALGSPVVTTDANKAINTRMAYTPYGQPMAPMDGMGYTGHFTDVGTQLTYMQQRYYDPQLARFLSVDPVASNSTSGDNFNRYRYANSNPYKYFDPDGRRGLWKNRIVTPEKYGDYVCDWNARDCEAERKPKPKEDAQDLSKSVEPSGVRASSAPGATAVPTVDQMIKDALPYLTPFSPTSLKGMKKEIAEGSTAALKASLEGAKCTATCAVKAFLGESAGEAIFTVHQETAQRAAEHGFKEVGMKKAAAWVSGVGTILTTFDAAGATMCAVETCL